jgi:hypothetical protein
MSDDRLLSALKRLGTQELGSGSDRAIRARLETAWTARPHATSMPRFGVQRWAPVLAAVVLIVGFSGTALGASADSLLWDTRVALEEAGASLRLTNDDRVAYLLGLVQSRTEEAARQEAAGHPGAAAKARSAASSAVVALDGNIPQLDMTVGLPMPSVTPSPAPATPSPTSAPSASRPLSPVPAVQPSASASTTPARTTLAPTDAPTATPLRTETPHPVPPTPTRTPTTSSSPKPTVTITGTVRDGSGAAVSDACISTSPQFPTSTTQCIFKTNNGSYGLSATVTPGQTITLYAYWISPSGENLAGSATTTVTAPTTVMPSMTLALRK